MPRIHLALWRHRIAVVGWLTFLLLCSRAEAAPTLQGTQPAAGTSVNKLSHLLVEFSEPVVGVQAGALSVDGTPATSVQMLSAWQYLFFFPPASLGNHRFSWVDALPVRSATNAASTFVPAPWSVRVISGVPAVPLQISQFVAVNKSSLKDQDGTAAAWLEIFNPTSSPVSLQGWSLSTNPIGTAGKWTFPNYLLDAGERMVVFASGKNRSVVTNELHASFTLKKADGYLALVDPSGVPASEFGAGYPQQNTDVAYFRDPISPDFIGFVPSPSPGKYTATDDSAFAAGVEASVSGTCFANAVTVTLSCPTSGAEVRYTTDGTAPTLYSRLATGPITFNATTRLRCRAFAPGRLPGPLRTETYVAIAGNLANTATSLPVLVLHNFGAGTPSTDVSALPQPVAALLYSTNGGRVVLTNAPDFGARAQISVHGSSTRGLPKQSWSMQFHDELDGSTSYAPLGLPGNGHWILYAPNNFEPVLMHNPLAYRLSNDIGRYAPRTRFVVVYLVTTSGMMTSAHYNGIYVLEEEIRHGKSRVDISKLDPLDNGTNAVTGGYVLKVDRLGAGESGLSAANQTMAFVDPSEATLRSPQRAPQLQYINRYMTAFGTALYGSNFRDPVRGYAAYIDTAAWVDHHILNVLTFNVDALRLSAFFHKPRQGKLFFGPVWDFDRTQGSTDSRDFNPRVWRSAVGDQGTDFFNYTWWDRLFRDPDFWQRWIDRYQALRDGAFSTTHINSVIDEFASQIRAEQPREATRWAGLTTPRSGSVSMSGYSYVFSGGYQGEVNFLKKWYADRLLFMDGNFIDRPVMLSNAPAAGASGFRLSFSAPAGAAVYYTTNGVDPRSAGGAVSDSALLFTNETVLPSNIRIRARSYDPNHHNQTGANRPPLNSLWSGERSAVFGAVNSADHVAYSEAGAVYVQSFDGLAAAGTGAIAPANPVLVAGTVVSLGNPFALADQAGALGAEAGLGLGSDLSGWWAGGDAGSKFGVSSGDQTTGGLISFGTSGSTQRALGLQATSSTGPTTFGVKLINASGDILDRIQISFTGSLWRQAPQAKTLRFGWKVSTNLAESLPADGWRQIPALDVSFAPLAPGKTPEAVDGTLAANRHLMNVDALSVDGWVPGAVLWLSWRMDDASGGAQGLGIDDLRFVALSSLSTDAPTISVTRLPDGGLDVAWPASAGAWSLQSTTALTTAPVWAPVAGNITSTPDGFHLRLQPNVGGLFLRLAR